MPTKIVDIPNVGPVVLSKQKGNRHLRLSVTGRGVVRVSLPYWAPYSSAITFATSRSQWIQQQLDKHRLPLIDTGAKIGKSFTVKISRTKNQTFASRISNNFLLISLPGFSDPKQWQGKIISSAEKALKKDAENLLPQRLDELAHRHGFSYKEVKIRKMTSRWGSCSSKKIITLSYYLVQLPWGLIDYVLVHELLHTRHMHHGKQFWDDFDKIMPGAKRVRRTVHSYKPGLIV